VGGGGRKGIPLVHFLGWDFTVHEEQMNAGLRCRQRYCPFGFGMHSSATNH
jgi:hypothetical protein